MGCRRVRSSLSPLDPALLSAEGQDFHKAGAASPQPPSSSAEQWEENNWCRNNSYIILVFDSGFSLTLGSKLFTFFLLKLGLAKWTTPARVRVRFGSVSNHKYLAPPVRPTCKATPPQNTCHIIIGLHSLLEDSGCR